MAPLYRIGAPWLEQPPPPGQHKAPLGKSLFVGAPLDRFPLGERPLGAEGPPGMEALPGEEGHLSKMESAVPKKIAKHLT